MANQRSEDSESDLPIGLSQPARRALAQAGFSRLEHFTRIPEADLRKLHGFGPKGLELIRRALSANGQSSADPGSNHGH